jgi:hypothetical protein
MSSKCGSPANVDLYNRLKKEVCYDDRVLPYIAVIALAGNVSLFMRSFSSSDYVTSNDTMIS